MKVDESTRAQIKAITNNEGTTELHIVRNKSLDFSRQEVIQEAIQVQVKKDAPDVEETIKGLECPAKFAKCKYCGKQGHYIKMCLKINHQKVNEIVTSPGYNGQGIYLGDVTADEETPNVFLGIWDSKKPDTVPSVTSYAKRIYTIVTLND